MINRIKKVFLDYRTRSNNEISYGEIRKIINLKDNVNIVDVRSSQEYSEYHLQNAINIPLYNIENNIDKFIKDKNEIIILYCQVGNRSKKAKKIIEKMGYNNVYNLKGGLDSI